MVKLNKRLALLEQKRELKTEEYVFDNPYLQELAAEFAARPDEDKRDYTGMTLLEVVQLPFIEAAGNMKK